MPFSQADPLPALRPALHCKPPIPPPLIFMMPGGFAVHRAGLCCTTHWVTVLGQAPRRLTGFMSSTQRGVPTRAGSPWDDTQENRDAEAPILWPPDVKSQLTGKDPDIGKG